MEIGLHELKLNFTLFDISNDNNNTFNFFIKLQSKNNKQRRPPTKNPTNKGDLPPPQKKPTNINTTIFFIKEQSKNKISNKIPPPSHPSSTTKDSKQTKIYIPQFFV